MLFKITLVKVKSYINKGQTWKTVENSQSTFFQLLSCTSITSFRKHVM